MSNMNFGKFIARTRTSAAFRIKIITNNQKPTKHITKSNNNNGNLGPLHNHNVRHLSLAAEAKKIKTERNPFS